MTRQTIGIRPSILLDQHRGAIRQRLADHGVVSAGVFGSVARGDDTITSDLDLIVDFEPGRERNVIGLELALFDLLGAEVDVVDARSVWRRATTTGIGTSILRETVPL